MGANGASCQDLHIAPKNRFHTNFFLDKGKFFIFHSSLSIACFRFSFVQVSLLLVFFEKVMDLSLLIFTLEIYQFCIKCIEFTTRTYNFKNLAVGSLIWGAKTGVNSSYFPQKIRYRKCTVEINKLALIQKISTCPVLCCILTLSASRVAWAYLELL
jgi:hypothetical protein